MMQEASAEEALQRVTLVDKGNPLWIPNSEAPRCLRCNNSFSMLLRRHHCRICGDIICKRCSYKANIKTASDGRIESHPDGEATRACEACRDQLLAGGLIDISKSHQLRDSAKPKVARPRPTAPPREKWVPNGASKTCLKCGNKFTLFVRRHHCRLCGHVICSKCTSWARCTVDPEAKTVRSDPLAKELRACHDCHEQVLQESVQQLQGFSSTSTLKSQTKSTPTSPAVPAVPLIPSAADWGDEVETTATALFDFDAEQEGDLAFREGDRIVLLSWSDNMDQWWEGKINGAVGIFPGNLVKLNP